MNVKRLGILSVCLAFVVALAVAFGMGATFSGSKGELLSPQVQQFARGPGDHRQ